LIRMLSKAANCECQLDALKGKRIAVLMGGRSSEREVSLRSGKGVLSALQRHGFDAVAIDPGPNLVQQIRQAEAEVCFNALHGGAGENGTIAAVLELAGIPYTGSGVLASALTMNKHQTKRILRAVDLPTPDWVYVSREQRACSADEVIEQVGLPCVVKPVDQGSSVGVSIPKSSDELQTAIARCVDEFGAAIIERFIEGPEITVGIIGVGPRTRALPVLELVPRTEFYSYEAKYTKGMTDLICPARISPQTAELAQEAALAAHKELGCLGISRVDMHVDGQGAVWIHEVNSVPGLTEISDIPAAAKAAGMSYDDVILEILASACVRMQRQGHSSGTDPGKSSRHQL